MYIVTTSRRNDFPELKAFLTLWESKEYYLQECKKLGTTYETVSLQNLVFGDDQPDLDQGVAYDFLGCSFYNGTGKSLDDTIDLDRDSDRFKKFVLEE